MSKENEDRVMRRMLAAADWEKLTSVIKTALERQGKSIPFVTYPYPKRGG